MSKRLRQQILDHLNVNPGQTPPEIAEAMNRLQDTIAKTLLRMNDAGEVRREMDYQRRGQPYRYWAEVAETKKYASAHKPEKPKVVSEPWRTVHRVTDRCKPIRNQGGQGALRREFGIQSVMA